MRASAYASGIPIFLTRYEVERAIRLARKYLTPTEITRVGTEHLMLPPGLDFDALDALEDGVARKTPQEAFVLFSEQRLNANKWAELVA